MSDEQEQEQEQEQEGPSEMGQVLAALKALQAPPKEPEAPPAKVPSTPEPPAPAGARITKAEYETLQRYAAEQRQRAERLALAHEYGLTEEELKGDFDSPSDMKRHAEVLALRTHLADLEAQLKAVQTAAAEPPEVPGADTGGVTSTEDGKVEELRRKYADARAIGRTVKSRQQLLAAIYGDPTKRSPIFIRT